jgi:shikimate dehydrogenase
MKVEYHNGTGLLAVIGDPIAHSLSPLLQNTMISYLGRDDLYLAVKVERNGLADFLQAAKTIGIQGFNLTMPHKETILPYLSDMTPEARRCGSVNSVRIRDGKLEGHSTDGLGFRRSLQDMGQDFPNQTVTILGAGGAAKSIAMTAVDAGAEVHILNRTLSKAEALCAGESAMFAHPMGDAAAVLAATDILVNTTPVGMEGVDAAAQFSDLHALKPNALAMDCIYAPARTPFMAAAQALGHPVANGIGMLVYQAIYAYAFFRALDFDEETVTILGQKLLAASGVDPLGGT